MGYVKKKVFKEIQVWVCDACGKEAAGPSDHKPRGDLIGCCSASPCPVVAQKIVDLKHEVELLKLENQRLRNENDALRKTPWPPPTQPHPREPRIVCNANETKIEATTTGTAKTESLQGQSRGMGGDMARLRANERV